MLPESSVGLSFCFYSWNKAASIQFSAFLGRYMEVRICYEYCFSWIVAHVDLYMGTYMSASDGATHRTMEGPASYQSLS